MTSSQSNHVKVYGFTHTLPLSVDDVTTWTEVRTPSVVLLVVEGVGVELVLLSSSRGRR